MVRITINNLQNKLPIPEAGIKSLVHRILKGEKVKRTSYINICFTDNKLIKKLNARFLNTPGTTDVIAFNLSSRTSAALLADIAISTESAISNSRSFKTSPAKELLLYVAHGILHVLGFDDHTITQTRLMRKKEREYVDR
ncbi:MAG: rRNA maturation RNase YbeY [Candidatus Omnitrophica bacterium]|jgi:probable rRNA maturation factor|nr:rRNA maturation RNase YbeY [Candidatus Omnitrophota bacterium]